jgi:hypothetical protein
MGGGNEPMLKRVNDALLEGRVAGLVGIG